MKKRFKQCIYLLGFFAFLVANTSAASLEQKVIRKPAYYPDTPSQTCTKTIELSPDTHDFMQQHTRWLDEDKYFIFEMEWKVRSKQENLRKLSPLSDEYEALKIEIAEDLQELKRLTNSNYEYGSTYILQFVNPFRMPRNLAWQLGILFGLYGNYQAESTLYPLRPSFESRVDEKLEAQNKIINCYKTSLLLFSYSLGLSHQSPGFLQHTDLDALISQPEFSTQLDIVFQQEFHYIDETAWIQAMQTLEQQRLEYICGIFRSFYRHFLQNRELYPKSHEYLAARLSSMTTKILLASQKNADFNLDAINPWMCKLYIDLQSWAALKQQDKPLLTPDLETLLLEVQQQCSKLLPLALTLEDITAENEFAICEQVRMRHFLPTDIYDVNRHREVMDEFKFSALATLQEFYTTWRFFDERAHFNKGYRASVNKSADLIEQIYNYSSGYVEVSEVAIRSENAQECLLAIKLFDLMTDVWNSGCIGFNQFYFPRSTYELRKKILKLCPHLTSYEVLTYSVNPEKVRDEKDETTPDSWVEESEILRQLCIDDFLADAQYLSKMMENSALQATIVGTRGNSGAGKSTFLKKSVLPLLLREGESWAEHIAILAKGILNPDTIKAALRKLQGDTLNTQIHDEGLNAFKQLFNTISENPGYILDKRHLTPHEIVVNLIVPAKRNASVVWLFDFDVPLTTSLSRILARPLHGDDPCLEVEEIIHGFLAVRRHRAQVISLALKEDTVVKYELYATCGQRLIAYKANEVKSRSHVGHSEGLCIIDRPLFDECLREPTHQEIEQTLSQIITDSFIDEAISKGDITPEQRGMLEKWRGLSLKESIQSHIHGDKGGSHASPFEPPMIFPFNGSEWLGDYPQLITFVKSEHLLHTHGVDQEGRGLHWEAEQFVKGSNPQYGPKAQAPGFTETGIQMRLGYFIVPIVNLDWYLSKNRCRAVTKELTVHNSSGEFIAMRFFVHPAAYAHFAPLLEANIRFVPPSESEFIGTPISTYNSWLVRCISTSGRTPFIVKMGTPSGSHDIKHLFAGNEVVKSIQRQNELDQLLDRSDFMLFKETVGLVLHRIPDYPAGTVDSGIVICELPDQLLKGKCKILSLASLMSCERAKLPNQGIAAVDDNQADLHPLPLIFELMHTSIEKGLVNTPEEFLQTYFIDAYLQAIEEIVFKEGYSLAASEKNLYVVLDLDNTVKGFAYRDLEGINLRKNFLESYAWYYRYANYIKLLNVLTQSDSDDALPLPGAPIRAGIEQPAGERNLYHYLGTILERDHKYSSLEHLQRLSITADQSLQLLNRLDTTYLELLRRYFAVDESGVLNSDGTVPCAEKGSKAEKALPHKNQALWDSRMPMD